jgi:hypothetical protein
MNNLPKSVLKTIETLEIIRFHREWRARLAGDTVWCKSTLDPVRPIPDSVIFQIDNLDWLKLSE